MMEELLKYLIKKKVLHPETDLKALKEALDQFKQDNIAYIYTWKTVKEKLPKLSKKQCKDVVLLVKGQNMHFRIWEELTAYNWYYYMKPELYISNLVEEHATRLSLSEKDLNSYISKIIKTINEIKAQKYEEQT